jgi:type VI secretion system lysozyme-like protein
MNPFEKTNQSQMFLPPLFDRLTLKGTQLLTEEEVIKSVGRELSKLLNTRLRTEQTVTKIDDDTEEDLGSSYALSDFFGLTDFSSFSLGDSRSIRFLEEQIQSVCAVYEPRLLNPKVTLNEGEKKAESLSLAISGQVMLGEKTIEVSFPISLPVEPQKG